MDVLPRLFDAVRGLGAACRRDVEGRGRNPEAPRYRDEARRIHEDVARKFGSWDEMVLVLCHALANVILQGMQKGVRIELPEEGEEE